MTSTITLNVDHYTANERLAKAFVKDCSRLLKEWPPEVAAKSGVDVYSGENPIKHITFC